MKNLKLGFKLAITAISILGITACFNDDDDKDPVVENTPPVALSVNLITQTDTPITDSLPATDADGDMLTFAISSEPMFGSIIVNTDGTYTYQPAVEYTGDDSFSYTVTDSQGATASGTIAIMIESLQVSLSQFTREAFNADAQSEPKLLNGREFIDDVSGQNEFQDLVDGN